MKNKTVRIICYMAMYAALYCLLKFVGEFIPFLKMPQGGSIEIEFVAIYIASFHLGWQYGALTGLMGFLLSFILGFPVYWLNIPQFALDYLIPLMVCGCASVFGKGTKWKQVLGIAFVSCVKYASQVLSGVYFWPPENEVAGSSAAWIYSLGYNAWYNLATCIVCAIIVVLLLGRLEKLSAFTSVE